MNARSYLHVYIKRGKIKKIPCAVCGQRRVEAHHADYNKPLEVVWLCREHHQALHNDSRAKARARLPDPAELVAGA